MSLDITLLKELKEDSNFLSKKELITIHRQYADYLEWNNCIKFAKWYKDNNTIEIKSFNITHNLNKMAEEAGIYNALWRPYKLLPSYPLKFNNAYDDEMAFEDNATVTTSLIIDPLELGLTLLKSNPKRFKAFNPDNGWGTYEILCKVTSEYLEKCKQNPNSIISVWR